MKEFRGDYLQIKTRHNGMLERTCTSCSGNIPENHAVHDMRLLEGRWANGFWMYDLCDRCIATKCREYKNIFTKCCDIIDIDGVTHAEEYVERLAEELKETETHYEM